MIGDIAKALESLCPGSTWILHDNDYSTLQWLDSQTQPPTENEIEQELQRITEEYLATAYQRLRAAEYPPLTDLADALYHQSKGDNTKMEAYLAACEAVKLKYPKGGE